MTEWLLIACLLFGTLNGFFLGWNIKAAKEAERIRRHYCRKPVITKVGELNQRWEGNNRISTLEGWGFDFQCTYDVYGYEIEELMEMSKRKEEFNL